MIAKKKAPMFSKSTLGSGEVCAFRLGGAGSYVKAAASPGRLRMRQMGLGAAASLGAIDSSDKKRPSILLLGPEAYACGLIASPGKQADENLLREAVKWTFAKESEIDLAHSVCDYLHVKGADAGGALLKDSYWIFAVEQAQLEASMRQCADINLKISVVDTVATAQRNLCYSEIRGVDAREGCYASIVLGEFHSSLNIASHSGDLLFHKQMEWSASSLATGDNRERLVVDLQRNLGYFERRLASFALVKGVVYGLGAAEAAAHLTPSLGSFEWSEGCYGEVDLPEGMKCSSVSGDDALLIGSLLRWV